MLPYLPNEHCALWCLVYIVKSAFIVSTSNMHLQQFITKQY